MNHFRRTNCRRGVAALEFALVLPFLALLMLGGADLTFMFIKKYRLDDTATAMGNLIAAANVLPASAFPASYCAPMAGSLNYFAIAYSTASPLPVCGASGATIISGITNNGTKTTIVWQERSGNAAAFPSLFGTAGAVPTLPPGYSVPSGHSIIATELYTGITPWVFSLVFMGNQGPTSLYAYSVFEPRLGTLVTPQ
jgi:Flp pilus assembly protein TadG